MHPRNLSEMAALPTQLRGQDVQAEVWLEKVLFVPPAMLQIMLGISLLKPAFAHERERVSDS